MRLGRRRRGARAARPDTIKRSAGASQRAAPPQTRSRGSVVNGPWKPAALRASASVLPLLRARLQLLLGSARRRPEQHTSTRAAGNQRRRRSRLPGIPGDDKSREPQAASPGILGGPASPDAPAAALNAHHNFSVARPQAARRGAGAATARSGRLGSGESA